MQLKNLTYILNNHILIDNLNIQSSKGLFFVYGPSGSGKTSLLKIIAGIIKPTQGKININEKLGLFWQDYNLLDLDIESNLKLPFLMYKEKIDTKRKKELLAYFNIKFNETTKISELSSGEKERIGLIKAFIYKPNLVLLDEAGNSLDENLKTKLLNFLLGYSKKNIIFLVSHDYYFKSHLSGELIYNKNFKIYKIAG